ncbi:hypothetical protein OROMI_031340 [Orobanche minor]
MSTKGGSYTMACVGKILELKEFKEKLSKANKKSRQQVKLPARLGRKDMANSIEEVRLQELKDKLSENLRDDIKANDEIYDEIVGIDAPGCLRSSIVISKNKEVAFTTQEELDRVVQDKTNNIVASTRKA